MTSVVIVIVLGIAAVTGYFLAVRALETEEE